MPKVLRPEVAAARRLRREMSYPEVLMWQRLRANRLGARFRRQHPLGPYVADFFCLEAALVIEIDGQAHDQSGRAAMDVSRDAFMHDNGIKVMRVPASDVLRDPDGVVSAIGSMLAHPLHHDAARRGPPPRAGEDCA